MLDWLKSLISAEKKPAKQIDRLETCREQGTKAKNDMTALLKEFPELANPIAKEMQAGLDYRIEHGKETFGFDEITPANVPQAAGVAKTQDCLSLNR